MMNELLRRLIPKTFLVCMLTLVIATLSYTQQSPWRRASGTEGQDVTSLDVYRANPDTLYALRGNSPGGFLRSADRGEHWENISVGGLVGSGPIRVAPTSSKVIYVSAPRLGGSGPDIWMTTDGGLNWRLVFPFRNYFLNEIEIDPADARTVYVGFGLGALFRSSDQGLTWDTLPFLPVFHLVSLAISAKNDSVLYIGSFVPGVHKSTDKGSTWIQMPFVTPLQTGPLLRVNPRNANTVYAAIWGQDTTRPGGVFKSTNGGLSWVEKNNGLRKQDRKIHDIVLNPRNPDDLFIGVSNESGDIVFRSTDGGDHWFGFGNGLPRLGGITSLALDSLNNRAYATGGQYPDSLGVFILDDLTTKTIEDELEVPRETLLNQNFPNPFNPSTRISYQLSKRSNVLLTVYDLMGRQVTIFAARIQGPGYESVQFDASNLPSGVYFYRLAAGEFYLTRKMLLVK